jgi:predicted TIM-barrel fold metal-dependent hydrolase
MIIDAHVHIFEEKMWPKGFLEGIYEHKKSTLSEEDFKHYKAEAKTETLIKEMNEARVDVAVCLPIDNAFLCREEPEIPVWKANEYVAEAQAKYPDRIIGFFGCDPMRADSVDMLEKGIRELGLKGVKLFPGWFYPNDERIAPYYQKIEELDVPVLIHSGSDPNPFLMKYGDPRYLDDLLVKYPRLKIIAAHISRGWENVLIQMMVYRPGRMWTDVACHQYEYMYARWHQLIQMRYVLDRLPDAVLFGSDWPFVKSAPFPSEKEWVEAFVNMTLPQACLDMGMKQFTKEEKNKLMAGNAQKLLNL